MRVYIIAASLALSVIGKASGTVVDTGADAQRYCELLVEGSFHDYGDLMRCLFPWPVTQRRRRRMITLGSGDATMSYDLSVRSQAHYLLARSVVEFLNRHRVSPVSPNACAERRRAGFGGYPVPPATFLCRWHEIRLTLHQAKRILPVGVGGFWGVQRRR